MSAVSAVKGEGGARQEQLARVKRFLSSTWARRGFREYAALLIIVLSACLAIVYSNVQTYDPVLTPKSGYVDSVDYIAMYHGKPGTGIRSYRPLVPWLARLVPSLPAGLFSEGRKTGAEFQVAVKFGVVNFFFLVGTCLLLYALMRDFQMPFFPALTGVLLFLTSVTIVRGAGLPMTDVSFFFFFTLAMLAMKRGWFWLLLVACTIGVVAKELMLLCVPMVLLTPFPWKKKFKLLGAVVPALVAYVLLRAYMPNLAPGDEFQGFKMLTMIDDQVKPFLRLNGWINLFWIYGFAWIPAIYALFVPGLPRLLKRWAWMVPIVLVGFFIQAAAGGIIAGNLVRNNFTLAPVVMCLAAFGIGKMVSGPGPEPAGAVET